MRLVEETLRGRLEEMVEESVDKVIQQKAAALVRLANVSFTESSVSLFCVCMDPPNICFLTACPPL